MSQTPGKKHRQKLARRQKSAEKLKHQQAVATTVRAAIKYGRDYPEFVFDARNAPGEFVSLVRGAAEGIDYDDRRAFSEAEAEFYRAVKASGAKAACQEFRTAQTGGRGCWEPGPDNWPRKLGQALFAAIPRDHLLRFAPYHDFLVHPCGRHVLIRFRSLVRVDTPGGPCYHSEHRPTVAVGGRPRVVCFRPHAVERVCERLVPGGWQTYDGLGEVFAYFHECQEFEAVTLHPDQTGFTFYDDCAEGFWSRRIAAGILGEQYRPGQDYSYRVGYCPAFVWGDYLVGKTLLYPGYGNTPEYGAIRRADLPPDEKQRLIGAVDGLTIHSFVRTGDFSLLKWFHEHGVPQVIDRRTRYRPA